MGRLMLPPAPGLLRGSDAGVDTGAGGALSTTNSHAALGNCTFPAALQGKGFLTSSSCDFHRHPHGSGCRVS